MSIFRRAAVTGVSSVLAVILGFGTPQPAIAADGPSGKDTNEAIAVNSEDGASVFRVAFSVVRVTDGTVDQENLAVAYASCTDCKTVALAFQVVIVVGDADYVAPLNQAGAINDQCAGCLTFASATQIVIRVDGPVKFTPEGLRRLAILARRMAELERNLDHLTAAELAAEVSSIEQELISILDEELVPADTPIGTDHAPGLNSKTSTTLSSTTTTAGGSATTTTVAPTTTTEATGTTTDPSTIAPSTTPTSTAAPDTSVVGE